MERKNVSIDELLNILNKELKKHPNTQECQFKSPIYPLQERDEYGCNWSDPSLRCSGHSENICKEQANIVLRRIKKQYNLKV